MLKSPWKTENQVMDTQYTWTIEVPDRVVIKF